MKLKLLHGCVHPAYTAPAPDDEQTGRDLVKSFRDPSNEFVY